MKNIPIPKSFLEKILRSINRLSENCVLNITKDKLYSICSSADNTIILYAKADIGVPIQEEKINLNIINIKKLLSGLECLGDNGEFSLIQDINHIKCQSTDHDTSEKTYFKYHLVDNSIIKEAPVSLNKIASLKFDTEFIIKESKIRQIMSGYAFVSDVSKIYFYIKDGKVNAEINDKTLPNVDNITLTVADSFEGEEFDSSLLLNMEVFKVLSTCKTDVKIKINNQYKVFLFQNVEDNNLELKYIVSALVK